MKKLKLSLIVAFVAMASIVGAQSASLSIKGGLNMSNFYGDNLNDKNMKPGFHIGVGADLEFIPNISLQTGLFFSTKGAKYTYDFPVDFVDDAEFSITANYLQLPIHIAYKIDVAPGTKLVLHAGPYIAYGIGGKRKIDSAFTDDLKPILGKQEINTFDKDFGYKPFDYGVGLGVGAEFGVFLVDLGWDMGLSNIARELKVGQTSYGQKVKNQSAYLSIGYKF